MVFSLILLQVVTFVVILLVMRFLFGSQLKIALNKLEVLHQDSLEKEEILNNELERAKKQSEAELSRAKEEAKLIVDTARRNAEKIASESEDRAQAEVKKLLADAADKAKRTEAEIVAGAEDKALKLSQELIRYTLSQSDQKTLQAQLVDEFIQDLEKVDKEKLVFPGKLAEISSAVALTAQQKEALIKALSSKTAKTISLEEKIDDTLVGGVVVKLGGLVIDASLKNKLKKALDAIRHKKI